MSGGVQLGRSRIDFLYEGRDALEVKTPLSAFPLERIGNPHLLRVRSSGRPVLPIPRACQATAAQREACLVKIKAPLPLCAFYT